VWPTHHFFLLKIYKPWKMVLGVTHVRISNFEFIRHLISSYIYRLQSHICVGKASRIMTLIAQLQLKSMLQINGFKFTFPRK